MATVITTCSRARGTVTTAAAPTAAAVARLGKLHLSGFIAWMIWVVIHILYLIGFRNRLLVMMQWAWAYVSYQRGIRLITGDAHVDVERARDPDTSPLRVNKRGWARTW